MANLAMFEMDVYTGAMDFKKLNLMLSTLQGYECIQHASMRDICELGVTVVIIYKPADMFLVSEIMKYSFRSQYSEQHLRTKSIILG